MFSEALTDGTAWKMFGWLQDELIKTTTCIYILFAILGIIMVLTIIILVRQRKIMKMLRDLTPPKAEPPKEEDTAAKETE